MPEPLHNLMSYLRVALGVCRDDPRDDAELLAHFAKTRDETAFAMLVLRHGKLVWRTCKAILHDTPDAEDVFQTVFLTLARKAGRFSIKSPAGWLHRVARQAALDVRAAAQRRQNLKHKLLDTSRPNTKNIDQTEQYATLDEEIADLPEKLRVPLVLHYLEEKTQVEVARILGCSHTAVQKRLAKGEAILRDRLERRGMTLGTLSLAALLGSTASTPAVPAGLIASTARAAVAFNAGALTGGAADAAQKLLHTLAVKGTMRKLWWVMLVCVGTFGIGGAGLVAWKLYVGGSDAARPETLASTKPALSEETVKSSNKRVDLYGDPLPDGALARIGTIRFRGEGGGSYETLHSDCNSNLKANVALSMDGKQLVLADGSNIFFWDVATGKQLRKVAMKCEQVAFSPDAKLLAVDDREAKDSAHIRLLDSETGQTVGSPLLGWGTSVFAPDGKTIACMCENKIGGTFYLYDVCTRKLLRKIGRESNYNCSPTFAKFSPNSRSCACVYEKQVNGVINVVMDLLDVKTDKHLTTLRYEQGIVQLVFSSEGTIITSGKDKIIRIRDVKTGRELHQLGPMEHVPLVLAFLPDGKTLLAACAGQVRFWDATTGQETRPALACKGMLRPIILSTDGTKLVEQIGNALSMWDMATGKEIGPTVGAPRAFTGHLVFSPGGDLLATEAEKMAGIVEPWLVSLQKPGMAAFYLWETATGKQSGSLQVPFDTNVSQWWEICWPSRDTILAQGQYVSGSGSLGKSQEGLTMWKMPPPSASIVTGKVLYLADASISADGQILACRRNSQQFELLEIATGKRFANVSRPNNPVYSVDAGRKELVFSADHQICATQLMNVGEGDLSPAIALWETSTGRKLYDFSVPVIMPAGADEDPLVDHLAGISPNGRLVVTCNRKTFAISLWEHVSGHVRLRLSMPTGCRESPVVAFSPDSRLVAVGCSIGQGGEKSIHIWDLATGRKCQCFQGHRAGTSCGFPDIAFSPDGHRLASAGLDYTVLIWDVAQPSIPVKASKLLNREELQDLKTALVGIDAEAANRAIWKLRQVPEQAVPLAVEFLRPQAVTPEVMQIAQEVNLLIDGLDSDDFQTRTKAAQELRKKLNEEVGEPIVQSMLGKALLGKKLSVEVNNAIKELLNGLKEEQKLGGAMSIELVRTFRGIELLELIHNDAAREILQKVAAAPPRPEVRREAEAALRRLANSPSAVMP